MENNKKNNENPRPAPEQGGAGPRRRKKRKTVAQKALGLVFYVVFVVLISCILSYIAIDVGNDMFGFIKPDTVVEISVSEENSLKDVTQILDQKGVISHPFIFRTYLSLSGAGEKINSGDFTLNTNMTYRQVAGVLTRSQRSYETVRITITEGMELRQIIALLDKEGVCSEEDLWETANNYDYSHEFLKDVPKRENRLEGYLFPDTYDFYKGDNPVQVFNRMLNNFAKKYTEPLKKRAEELGMTMDEVIILASIIEREAAKDSERPVISAVFHNRLKKGSNYPLLQSCATVQYILKERKPVLSDADTKIESPYNTYIHKGLPVGPIASPGLASIQAALDPVKSSYMFFVANADGTESYFAKTYEEHQKNIAKVAKEREAAA